MSETEPRLTALRQARYETGKVKVKPKINYTPNGGDPNSQSIKVKLKRKQ